MTDFSFGARVIICENMRSLHNVGAVFRTADAAGWDHVCLTGYTGTPPDRRIEKVSLGAEDTVGWSRHEDAVSCVQELKAAGYAIIALELTDTAQDIFSYTRAEKPVALVLGNEVEGVSDAVLALCDTHVMIPMRGHKASLNVSVACGIALYAMS